MIAFTVYFICRYVHDLFESGEIARRFKCVYRAADILLKRAAWFANGIINIRYRSGVNDVIRLLRDDGRDHFKIGHMSIDVHERPVDDLSIAAFGKIINDYDIPPLFDVILGNVRENEAESARNKDRRCILFYTLFPPP